MNTTPKSKPPSTGPSPELKRMLRNLTPEQREETARIVSKLLAIKARSQHLTPVEIGRS